MSESPLASSTPDPNKGSTYQRKQEWAERFLAGTSRAAYRLDPLLERSLSASENSQGTESDAEEETSRARKQVERRADCKRGCAAVLKQLAKAYESFGFHTGKAAQYRKSSYPNPKKGKSPRNYTLKLTESCMYPQFLCLVIWTLLCVSSTFCSSESVDKRKPL